MMKTVARCIFAVVLCGVLEPQAAAGATRAPEIWHPASAASRPRSLPTAPPITLASKAHIASAPGPVLTLTANTLVALVSQPITFSAAENTVGVNMNIDFGDATSALLPTGPPQTVTHAYAAPGTYHVVLTQALCVIGCPTPASLTITILAASTFALTATPTTVLAGQPVRFHASNAGGAPLPGEFISFGDGSSVPVTSSNFFVNHAYAVSGQYFPLLRTSLVILTPDTLTINVLLNQTRVPIGQIYSALLVGSPVLAGNDANIVMTYRVYSPLVVRFDGLSPLQAIVELDDTKGHVVRRADPFPLHIAQSAINDVQTTIIPYSVPIDAGGAYFLRVYIRVDAGGTMAIGQAQPLTIIPGPDPGPVVKSQFRANGTAETRSGGQGGTNCCNIGMTTAVQWSTDLLSLTGTFDPVSKKIDPLATLQSATPAPLTAPDATPGPGQINPVTTTPGQTGSPAPAGTGASVSTPPPPSTTPEPKATPASTGTPAATPTPGNTPRPSPAAFRSESDAAASATPVPAPSASASSSSATPASAATPEPATPAPQPAATPPAPSLQYKDVLGRTDADLPSLVGGKQTWRGFDATYVEPNGWTLHGGAGYLQLASQDTTERSGELFDVAKHWGADSYDAFRLAFTRNEDNVNKFVPTSGLNPLDVSAGVFDFAYRLTPHLTTDLSAGKSSARDITGMTPSLGDASDTAQLGYTVGSVNAALEYHNGGPAFGTGSGASARTDDAGSSAILQLPTSAISTLALNWGRDDHRSAFNHTSTGGLLFNLTPSNAPTLSLQLGRDRATAPGTDTTTRSGHITLTRSGITADYLVSASANVLAPDQNSVTHTGNLTYALTAGTHVIGLGLTGTQTVSSGSSATFTETANYGFTFGGRPAPLGQSGGVTRNFEFRLGATNINTQAGSGGEGHTLTLSGLLTWHVTPQFGPGLDFSSVHHIDVGGGTSTQTSALRLRMDVQI